MSFPTTPAQKFRAALASPKSSISLLERLFDKVHATQPHADPLDSLRNTDPSTRQTSLHIAANAGRVDVVEWLLDQGVEKEISRDAAGETVLHIAAAKGFVEILIIYLERFQFVVDWVNSRGATALHAAAMKGELEAAQILIDNGADINAPDLHGNAPLHYALSYGKLSVVKLLVELDCETDLKNNQGFSASDYAYSFSCADALKVYIRLHQDALKSARASKSRRPRNARIDSGASSSSRGGHKPSRTGSSSDLSTTIPPVSPPPDDLTSPPLQPIASPSYSQPAASPALSETAAPFPARYGLGVRLSGSLRRNSSDGGGGRDSPLPAPIAVRPAPTSPSIISLQPATPTTPNTPGSPSYSQYNTTSPARSPVQNPASSSSPGRNTDAITTRPQQHSPLSLPSRSRENSRTSKTSSYFPPAGSNDTSIINPSPSGSPSSSRPPPVPLNLPRSHSSSSELIPTTSNGPKKLRKKGGRRDSVAQEQQQQQTRPLSVGGVPVGSTVLGGGPGGKKLRSERSMSFGTAMTSTGDIPAIRAGLNGGGGGGTRSRSTTNQSMGSLSSSSGHEMLSAPIPTLQERPVTTALAGDDQSVDMLPASPQLGRPILSPPSPESHSHPPPIKLDHPPSPPPVPYLSPTQPTIPPVDSVAALTTRSHEPSFLVVSGSSTKNSPNPPSHPTFTGSASETVNRSSQTSSRNSISLGRPLSSGAAAGAGNHEVAKLRKSSAQSKMRERSASEVSKDSKAGAGGGRFARVLGFGRKVT
ncbi:uncharacterized protein JCM6883_001481 [Sporobolomyces salmoneus]|uniref:uncharacterized protein n=1 Tax=Sporobolomyces salmoneus TaxID=183962 RepID=UPI00316D9D29